MSEEVATTALTPLVAKVVAVLLTAAATYLGGEYRGAESMTGERNARVPMETVVHLSGVISDLQRQLADYQSRACPTEETQ